MNASIPCADRTEKSSALAARARSLMTTAAAMDLPGEYLLLIDSGRSNGGKLKRMTICEEHVPHLLGLRRTGPIDPYFTARYPNVDLATWMQQSRFIRDDRTIMRKLDAAAKAFTFMKSPDELSCGWPGKGSYASRKLHCDFLIGNSRWTMGCTKSPDHGGKTVPRTLIQEPIGTFVREPKRVISTLRKNRGEGGLWTSAKRCTQPDPETVAILLEFVKRHGDEMTHECVMGLAK